MTLQVGKNKHRKTVSFSSVRKKKRIKCIYVLIVNVFFCSWDILKMLQILCRVIHWVEATSLSLDLNDFNLTGYYVADVFSYFCGFVRSAAASGPTLVQSPQGKPAACGKLLWDHHSVRKPLRPKGQQKVPGQIQLF